MGQILVDFARAQGTGKRGQRAPHVDLSDITNLPECAPGPAEFIDLDRALDDLSKLDPRQAQVVELRYFGGLENGEVAAVLGISEPTVLRDWRVARAWLCSRLQLGLG